MNNPLVTAATQAEMLTREVELNLARRWRDYNDTAALQRLAGAYMRLVPRMARHYRSSRVSQEDLIQCGCIGLMKAAKKFNPDRGFRLSTYAIWWIRAELQDCVLRGHSLIKIGTTSTQRKIFFSLVRTRENVEHRLGVTSESSGRMDSTVRKEVAAVLGVSHKSVEEMEARMHGDSSLNTPSGGDDRTREWIDILPGSQPASIDMVVVSDAKNIVFEALQRLSDREQTVIMERKYTADDPTPLGDLGIRFGVSHERIRQIEAAGLAKMRDFLQGRGLNAPDLADLF